MSEFFKKVKLYVRAVLAGAIQLLENSQEQMNSKLNEKNRMITY